MKDRQVDNKQKTKERGTREYKQNSKNKLLSKKTRPKNRKQYGIFSKKTLRNHQLQQLSFYTDYTHQTKSEYSTLVISGYSLGPQSNAVDVKEKIPKDSSSNLI